MTEIQRPTDLQPRQSSSRGRYAHIDAMRAVAVLLVVIGHLGLGHLVPGGSGVTIFFAISGFIITTLILREWTQTSAFDIGGFYTRRLVKLMPPLIVLLIVPTVIYALAGGAIDWSAFSGQIFFYFNWIKLDHPNVLPGSAVVWSLSIEEQFYIFFAVLWLVLARTRRALPLLAILAVLAIMMSTTARLLIADPGNEAAADHIYYDSHTRADSIAWGVVAAIILYAAQREEWSLAKIRRVLGSDWTLVAALLMFAVSLIIRDDWYRQTFRYSTQSVSACLVILYGFLAGETLINRVFRSVTGLRALQIVGLASYSIYLVHLTIVHLLRNAAPSLGLPVMVLIGMTTAVAVGVGVYQYVEKPARSLYDRLRARRQAAEA